MSLYTDLDHVTLPIGPDGTPLEFLEALQREAHSTSTPIGWSERYGGFWVVTGHQAARTIFLDPVNFSNETAAFPNHGLGGEKLILTTQDNPEHGKYRTLVQPPFSPATIAEYEDPIRSATVALIDDLCQSTEVDLFADLAQPIPAMMTAMILGLSPDDGKLFWKWTTVMTTLSSEEDLAEALPTILEMHTYFDDTIADRRKNLGNDILSMLMESRIDGETLSDVELKQFWMNLMLGGIENTALVLATAMWRMAWDKELARRLVEDPNLLHKAIPEFNRYYMPGLALGRRVLNDTTVCGVSMRAGEQVVLLLPVINRDQQVFAHPNSFIADRTPNKHISFGLGIHRCLGAVLADLEMRVVLEEVLRRIPAFELDPTRTPKWQQGLVAGMEYVPVVLGPTRSTKISSESAAGEQRSTTPLTATAGMPS